MERTPRLYETLVDILPPHQHGLDLRHLKPLAWMTVGLMQSGTSSLTAWVPAVHSRAVYAQRVVRRVARWLEHDRIDGHALDGPLLPQALAEGGEQVLDVALATSLLWHTSGVVRIALVYRGRAIPMGWTGVEHASRRVTSALSQGLLEQVAELRPFRCHVVFTADRGCADTPLMAQLVQWSWPWRLRSKGRFWLYQHGTRQGHVSRLPLSPGQARCWPHVDLTKQEYGPVHLARGRPLDSQAYGFMGRDEPTEFKTCAEYGRRFDIEETGLDDQSNGFQLESSLIRSANA